MSKFELLFSLWKEYFNLCCTANPHLEKPLFHVWLGQMLDVNYYFGGRSRNPRLHSFIVQPSGTGKGEGMKSLSRLLEYTGGIKLDSLGVEKYDNKGLPEFKKKCVYITKTTDAGLTGSFELDPTRKGNLYVRTNGLLEKYDLICWDEGSLLLSSGKTSYMATVMDVLQMAMDDPGLVSHNLKAGLIQFYTNTSIVTGSYPAGSINEAVMQRGLMQRMIVTFEDFGGEKFDILSKNKYKLYNVMDVDRVNDLMRTIKGVFEGVKIKSQIIRINEDVTKYFSLKLMELKNDNILKQYTDKRQDILYSFFNRIDILCYKVAVHRCCLDEREYINTEDIDYGIGMGKDNMKAVRSLLDNMVKKDYGIDLARYRWDTIADLFVSEGMTRMNKGDLIRKLKKLKQDGRWDLGLNRTTDFLSKCVSENRLGITVDKEGAGRPETVYIFYNRDFN